MNDFKKDQLQIELDNLRLICLSPLLYLINYFSDLRSQVDIEILRKQLIKPFDLKKNKKIKELWIEMIAKIEIFEKKCIKNKFNLQAEKERLGSIDALLNDENKLKDLNKIKKAIEIEEYRILSELFKNQTIAFVNIKQLNDKQEKELLIDKKLVILNDGFIRLKSINQK
jgi:hypothetical protein